MNNSYFYHETSIISADSNIGDNTKIWQFCHILGRSIIGKNCVIGQNVMIGPDVKIGSNCKIQNNVSIYNGVECEDCVFLGPSCVLTNDYNPRTEYPKNNYKKTKIKYGATIGANATILCNITIGKYSLIGAGAVVLNNVPDYAVMVGNPAKQIGTIDEFGNITKL